jgi:hypothetical protein
MFDWNYWRWQIVQKLPVATLVGLLVTVIGWVAIDAVPLNHTATARIVLERKIGLTGASKAQRTSEEVQHLQVVIHTLKGNLAFAHPNRSDVVPAKLEIQTSRDKPSYLFVETTSSNATGAIEAAHSIVTQALEVSEAAQDARTGDALSKLHAEHTTALRNLDQARSGLSTHLDKSPAVRTETLREQAAQLRSKLQATVSSTPIEDPTLKKLRAELSVAKGLYSDIHPKVRVIRARISRAQTLLRSPSKLQQEALQMRLDELEKKLLEQSEFQETALRLESDVTNFQTAQKRTYEALTAAQRASESSHMRLRVIQDATAGNRDPIQLRGAMQIALLFIALIAAISTVALKIRFDPTLRRPGDLHRSLGLTPFATLPDLGPSLG